MLYLGIFLAKILKEYCHIWNQQSQIYEKWVFLTQTIKFGIGSAFLQVCYFYTFSLRSKSSMPSMIEMGVKFVEQFTGKPNCR